MNFYVKNVQLLQSSAAGEDVGSTVGTLHILGTHLVFKTDSAGKELWIVHTLIGSVEKAPISVNGSRLVIRCKHFLVLPFLIPKEKDSQSVFDALSRCIKLVNVNELFAFAHKNDKESDQAGDGSWNRFNWEEEFARQGVNDAWKMSSFNQNYAYCDTYPENLWLPSGANTQILIGSCKFRSKARLPVLTYFHNNCATICRSSQPLSGFSARCMEDECLIELIMSANPSSSTLYLIDTRPRVNAMVNKVQGKGFEDSRNYTNIQFHSFDIENIHIVRASLNKLLEACQRPQSMTQYLKAIESSGWLRHLRILLECGHFIADSILRGISCVVHCSDGWDRTSQTVSIAQLILDPFYRTIKGFQSLIDKDWLGFGFKFDDRCGHLGVSTDDNEREISPIFTQFIDVVYQLMRNRPLVFEFNERFLLELNEYAYSCVYGHFIGNCDKDRKDLRITARTKSLWSFVNSHSEDYKNPFYRQDSVLFPCDNELQPSSFVVWTKLYNRFDSGIQPREYFADTVADTKTRIQFLSELLEQKPSTNSFGLTNCALSCQSQLNADDCSNPKCSREFLSRFDRRIHCYTCGRIFCHKCCKPDDTRPKNFEEKLFVCCSCKAN